MHAVCCNVAALAVASLYYYWRSYHAAQAAQDRTLRQRVAYMLWVMAGHADDAAPEEAGAAHAV